MSDPSRRALPVLQPGSTRPGSRATSAGAAPAGVEPGGARSSRSDPGSSHPMRVAMVTLGCDKNTVDSERILSGLLGAGMELVQAAEDADVVVVNTCGFIELAKQESIDTLIDAARLKETTGVRAVVGMGCLVQRYRPDLEREMPEVDLFLGLTDAAQLVPELARRGFVRTDVPTMERPLRVLAAGTGPAHTAHLKISEGCDHSCAFCAIPLMRGKFRSTPLDLLVREAQELERRGVVELNIVSQDTTWYGRDWARAMARGGVPALTGGAGEDHFLGRPFAAMPNVGLPEPSGRGYGGGLLGPGAGPRGDRAVGSSPGPDAGVLARVARTGALPLLLETLLAETAIPWYRLFYMYPSGITRELVELIAREDRILPYLDMPIQHGSDRVLTLMRRPERRTTILERARWLRDAVPALALRTTVIVGFPGETEDDFDSLLALLDEVRFDHLGAFAYSEEEDTPAATMDAAVPAAVRRERLERVLDHQRSITMDRNEERIGHAATVLVDEVMDGAVVARAPWQGPEVDGVVHIEREPGQESRLDRRIAPGCMLRVVITGADEYDLTGRIVDEA